MNENWVFGAICSIALHAVGLGLLIGYGGGSSSASASAGAEDPAPVADVADSGAPAESAPAAPVDSAAPSPARTEVAEGPEIYVVKPGDNLTRIARDNGTTPEALAEINGKSLKQMNLLHVGQKIKLR